MGWSAEADYTKGIIYRSRTYQQLLTKHPEYIEQVVLLQIAVTSKNIEPLRKRWTRLSDILSDYIYNTIDERLTASFPRPIGRPSGYIYWSISQAELVAFYRDAAVCVVTALIGTGWIWWQRSSSPVKPNIRACWSCHRLPVRRCTKLSTRSLRSGSNWRDDPSGSEQRNIFKSWKKQ